MAHWKYRKKSSCLVSRCWLSSLHLSKCLIKLKVWITELINGPNSSWSGQCFFSELIHCQILIIYEHLLTLHWLSRQMANAFEWGTNRTSAGFCFGTAVFIVLLFSWFSSNSGNTGITFSVLRTTIKRYTRIAAGLICNSTSVACMWYEVLKIFCLLTM